MIKHYGNEYPQDDINRLMKGIYQATGIKFVLVIDEWDCILREYKDKIDWQKKYLDFLSYWFKDQEQIALVYMTGILPIKKYGTHSALNMFTEYSMLSAEPFTEFIGFTEEEVKKLCVEFDRNFAECKRWYDGYQIDSIQSIYNPRSVNSSINTGKFRNYWSKTETYEALQFFITLESFDLHETVTKSLSTNNF